jgi:hypothetical protein
MRKHTLTILSFNQKESSTGVAVTGSESGHEGGGLRKGNQNSRSSRRLQTEPCLLLLKLTLMKDGSESEEVDCYDPSTEQFVRISGSSQLLKGFHDGVITSGRSTLMQEGAYFDDVEGSLIFPDLANVQYVDEEPEARRKLAVTTGTKKMLAVRVIASDATTTSTESEISDAWFGTSGDAVNLKSQYEACSYNKIQIDPANTTDVSNGVKTVTISNTVNGTADGVIRDAVTTALGSSFTSQFDHVMLCLPPGTSEDWIAYAYFNYWLSVYNNEWCDYVSAQMHGK